MTNLEREEMKKAVREAVAEAMSVNTCQCGLTPAAHSEMGHLCGVMRDMGDGDMSRGVEVLRENSIFVRGMRKCALRIGWTIISVAIGAAVIFAGGAFWAGLRAKVGQP
jgi:hypothetical protein